MVLQLLLQGIMQLELPIEEKKRLEVRELSLESLNLIFYQLLLLFVSQNFLDVLCVYEIVYCEFCFVDFA